MAVQVTVSDWFARLITPQDWIASCEAGARWGLAWMSRKSGDCG
ncbi:MAG: hypothetical protein WCK86_12120 [Planctomycetia bacterium]